MPRSLSEYRVERLFLVYRNPSPRHDLAFGQVMAHRVELQFSLQALIEVVRQTPSRKFVRRVKSRDVSDRGISPKS